MEKKQEFFIAVIALFLISLSFFVILSEFSQEFKYSVSRDGVEFVSNEAPPGELMQGLSEKSSFIVVSEFRPGTGTTTVMAEPLTMFNSVLVSLGKNVVTIAKETDATGKITACQTNDGNVLENRRITVEECSQLLSDSSRARIIVGFPSNSGSSLVIVSSGLVEIQPASLEEVTPVTFLALQTMYSDSREILEQINRVIGQV